MQQSFENNGSSGDLISVMFKAEVIVKYDSEVATVMGWRQGGGVNERQKVSVVLVLLHNTPC